MSHYTDRTIQKLQEYEAALHASIREAIVAVRGSQEFHDAVEDLLKDTPHKKPVDRDYEGLYGRVRDAIKGHDADIIQALKNYGADIDCGACMEVAFTGVTTNAHTCKREALAGIVEEFVGWWWLHREGSVNRSYDYIDKITKRLQAATSSKCDGNHAGPRCADPECWNQ